MQKPPPEIREKENRPLMAEQLEPRILYSATPGADPAAVEEPAQTDEAPATEEPSDSPAPAVESAAAPAPSAEDNISDEALMDPEAETLDAASQTVFLLNQEDVETIAAAAADRWEATGLSQAQQDALASITYRIGDLAGYSIGETEGNVITIDDDAAGLGWFLDTTPDFDEEYEIAVGNSGSAYLSDDDDEASRAYDLLTVLLHEQGHLLGLEHVDDSADVMFDYLDAGERRLPTVSQADGAESFSLEGSHSLHLVATLDQVSVSNQGEWDTAVADGLDATKEVVFSGSTEVISVTGDVTVGALHFLSGDFTLSGGGLTIGGAAGSIHADVDATIESTLKGNGDLTKSGAGTLTLTGANTYQGDTIITEGTLLVDAGTISNTNSVDIAGGTLRVLNDGEVTVTNGVTNSAGSGNLHIDGGIMTIGDGLDVDNLRVGSTSTGSGAQTATLTVNSGVVLIGDGSGNLDIGIKSGSGGASVGTLDLSSATSVEIDVTNVNLGILSDSGGSGTRGTLNLSNLGNNTLSATAVTLGNDPVSGNQGVTSTLLLGQTVNNLNIDTFTIAQQKSKGTVTLAANGVLNLTGDANAGTDLLIGYNNNVNTGTISNGVLDVSAGTFNGTLNDVTIGHHLGGPGRGLGTLTMSLGTVTARTLTLGDSNPPASTNSLETEGTLNQLDGTFTVAEGVFDGGGSSFLNVEAGDFVVTAGGLQTDDLTVGYADLDDINGATKTANLTVSGGAVTIGDGPTSDLKIGYNTGSNTSVPIAIGDVDFTQADSVTVNVGGVFIGSLLSRGGGGTLGNLELSNIGENTLTADQIIVGDCPNPGNQGVTSTLTFGSNLNTVNVDTFDVGARKSRGTVDIELGGTLTLSGNLDANGEADLRVGINDATNTGTISTGVFDMSNGVLNATLDEIILGRHLSSTGGNGSGNGTLTLNQGIISANSILLADPSPTSGTPQNTDGILNLGGAILNLKGGDITEGGGTEAFNFTSGTLKDVNLFGTDLIQQGGTLQLGADGQADTMTVAGDFTPSTGATIEIDLNSAGSGDQLVINDAADGSIDLNDATLALALNYIPAIGDSFEIVSALDSGDSISGNFAGLDEGYIFPVISTSDSNTYLFSITYTGGTGNDIVLTSVGAADTSVEIVGDNLVISDISQESADKIDVSFQNIGGVDYYVIKDTNATPLVLSTTLTAADANRISLNEIHVRVASVSGGLEIGTENPDAASATDEVTLSSLPADINGAVTINAESILVGSNIKSDAITLTGEVTLTSDVTWDTSDVDGAISVTGTLSGADHNLTLTTGAGIGTFTDTVTGLEVLTLTDTGIIDFQNGFTSDSVYVAVEGGVATLTVSGGDAVVGDGDGLGDVFMVAQRTQSLSAATIGTFDVSAANSFVADVSVFQAGSLSNDTGTGNVTGTVNLSANTTVDAVEVILGKIDGGNVRTVTGHLNLNASNTFKTDIFTVGGHKGTGNVSFAAAGTLTLAGLSSAKAELKIGDNSDSNTSSTARGTMDLSGGVFDANLDVVIVGDYASDLASPTGGGSGSGIGTLILSDSASNDIDATAVELGSYNRSGSGGSGSLKTSSGTITMGGGTFDVVGNVMRGQNLGEGNGAIVEGSLYVEGGTFTVNGNLVVDNLLAGKNGRTALVTVLGSSVQVGSGAGTELSAALNDDAGVAATTTGTIDFSAADTVNIDVETVTISNNLNSSTFHSEGFLKLGDDNEILADDIYVGKKGANGTLTIEDDASLNIGDVTDRANLHVGYNENADLNTTGVMNLSNAATFDAFLNTFAIGQRVIAGNPGTVQGTVTLAATNRVDSDSVLVSRSDMYRDQPQSVLTLGADNTFDVDTFTVAGHRGHGLVEFAAAGSLLTLSGSTNTGTNLRIGETDGATTNPTDGEMNLNGGTFNATLSVLDIAERDARDDFNPVTRGTLSFDSGTVTADLVIIGVGQKTLNGDSTTKGEGRGLGILNIAGDAILETDDIQMAIGTSEGSTGTINQSNGEVDLLDGTISEGIGTADYNLNDGVLKDVSVLGFDFEQEGGTLQIGGDGEIDTMTIEGDFTGSGGTIELQLDGVSGAGVAGGHDQIIIADTDGDGALDLTGSTLDLTLNFAAGVGQTFTLIDNDTAADPVTGTFAGMPEDTVFELEYLGDRYVFQIHYNTEDGTATGNNVVLQSLGVAETSVEIDGAGNLVVSDINNESADLIDISVQNIAGEDYYVIKDTNATPLVLTTSLAAGDATQVSANEIHVNVSSVTGGVTVGTANPTAATLDDVVTLSSLPASIAGDITIHAETINIGTDVTSTGEQTFDGAVTLTSDVTLAGTNVTFGDKLNSDSDTTRRTLVVNTSGNGVTTFGNTVGGDFRLESLTTNADGSVLLSGSVTTGGHQTYNDAVTLTGNRSLNGNTITLVETVTNGGNNLSVTGSEIDILGGIDGGGGDVNLTATSRGIHVADAITTTGGGDVRMSSIAGSTTGVLIEADVTTEAGDIEILSRTSTGIGVVVTSADVISSAGDIRITGRSSGSAAVQMDIDAASSIITTDGAITLKTVTGDANIAGVVDSGAHLLIIESGEDLNLNDATLTGGNIDLSADNDVNLTSGTSISGSASATGNIVLLSENFEGFAQGSSTPGFNGVVLDNGWENLHLETLDFVSDKGGTPSGQTGPGSDHTTGTATGTYLYMETSSPAEGEFAYLLSPEIDLTGESNSAVEFYYHMYGEHIGQLVVEGTGDGGTTWTELLVISGDQGNEWNQAQIDLSPFDGSNPFQLRLKGVRGDGYQGDISLDDFRFYSDSGDVLVEDFEDDAAFGQGPTTGARPQQTFTSDWSNATTSNADEIDWVPDTGGTGSPDTGPGGGQSNGTDHTLGTADGTYLYIETSGPVSAGEAAQLYSPRIDLSEQSTASVEFYYHMFDNARNEMGTLNVYGSSDGGQTWSATPLFTQSGSQGNQWNYATIDLSSFAGSESFRLRVEGVAGTGYASDISIDDFRFFGDPVENTHISITADADSDESGSGGSITMADGSTVDAGDGNVTLKADGNIVVSSVTTTATIIAHSTSGAILDGGDSGTDLTASVFIATAGNGIGNGNELDTALENVEADGGSGGVAIANTGTLTIGETGADLGVTGGGTVNITSTNDLIVATNTAVTGLGVRLTADNDLNVRDGAQITGLDSGVLLQEDFESFVEGSETPGASDIALGNGWVNVQGSDELDWSPDAGGTPSGGTGPGSGSGSAGTDHTTGTTSGKYLYLETSDFPTSAGGYTAGVKQGQTATMHSPVIDLSQMESANLEFWYYAYGADIVSSDPDPTKSGRIEARVSIDGGSTFSAVLLSVTDNKAEWQQATLDLSPYLGNSSVVIRIDGIAGNVDAEGSAGYRSDLAIDDFRVTGVPSVALTATGGALTMAETSTVDGGDGNVGLAADGDITVNRVATTGDVTLTSATGEIRDRGVAPEIEGGTVTFNGNVAPGLASLGTLVIDGNLDLAGDDTLTLSIDGTTPGTEHDQLVITGSVAVDDATLDLTLGYTPADGDILVLIDNDGTDNTTDGVSGRFELPDGTVLSEDTVFELVSTVDGKSYVFQIHYNTEDGSATGNNVVLESFGVAETSVEIDGSGNLVITDINGGVSDDNLTISEDGAGNYIIFDPNLALTTVIPGATRIDGNTISVPKAELGLSGGLIVNTEGDDGSAPATDVVTFGGTNPISFVGDVVVNAETERAVLAQDVTSSTGSVTFNGPVSVSASSKVTSTLGDVVFVDAVDLGAAGSVLTVDVAGLASEMQGVVSGDGALTKDGDGTLTLNGANTYAGLTMVADGVLKLNHATALGASTGVVNTVVQNGGALDLNGFHQANERIEINGPGSGAANTGALFNSAGSMTNNGVRYLSLGSDASVGNDGGRFGLNSGTVTGAFNLTKVGNNDIWLSSNVQVANLIVDNGVYGIQGNNADNITGSITVNADAILATWRVITIDAPLNFNDGRFRTGGNTAGENVTLNGDITLTGTNNRFELSSNVSAQSNGAISGAGSLIKIGAGVLTLAGTDDTYSGDTTVSAGTLFVNGVHHAGAGNYSIAGGTLLGGTGTITTTGIATVDGILATGDPETAGGIGTLTVNGDISINNQFQLEIDGATSDTLSVTVPTEEVSLGGAATLVVTDINDPTSGSTVLVIDNAGTDAVNGLFTSDGTTPLAEGSTVMSADGNLYTISYVGIDGNDVVLFEGEAETNVDLSGGVLTISDISNENADEITVSYDSLSNEYVIVDPNLLLTTSNLTAGQFSRPDAHTVRVDATLVSSVVVTTELDNPVTIDTVTISSLPASIAGPVTITAESINLNTSITSTGAGGDITLNGDTTLGNSVTLAGEDVYLNGTVAMGANDLTVSVTGNAGESIGGISGTGQVIKQGDGLFTLKGTGTTSNSYTGLTHVQAGSLYVGGNFVTDGAIQGDIAVDGGANLLLLQSEVINNASSLSIATGGSVDWNNQVEAIGNLNGGGDILRNTNAVGLTLDNLNGTHTFSGDISGVGGVIIRGNIDASGEQEFSGGTYDLENLRIGNGTLTLKDDAIVSNTNTVVVGSNRTDIPGINAGDVTGTLNIESGTLDALAIITGNRETGTVTSFINQSGGTVTTTGNAGEGNGLRMAHWGSSISSYTLSGGTLTIGGGFDLSLATTGSGTFTQTGGTLNVEGIDLNSRVDGNGSGTLNLTGGELFLGSKGISEDTGTPATTTLNLGGSGHTIVATADFVIATDATLLGSGDDAVTIDTNGFDVTAPDVFSGAGALIKSGDGTLVITGSNTYSGTTTIDGGTLQLDGAHSGGALYTVNDGATLAGEGSTDSAVTVANDGILAPGIDGPGDLETGTVSFGAGATFTVDIDGTTAGDGAGNYDQLVVTGAVNLQGAPRVILVTDSAAVDQDTIDFILAEFPGVTVEAIDRKYHDTLGDGFSDADKADLQAADLVIVSRQTNSGDYDIDIEFWKSLDTPILLQSAFLARSNRWDWVDSESLRTGTESDGSESELQAAAANDPLLAGVTSPADLYDIDFDAIANSALGDGQLLATGGAGDYIIAARWNKGDAYGSDGTAGDDRILLMGASGNNVVGLTEEGMDVYRRVLSEFITPTLIVDSGIIPIPGNTYTIVDNDGATDAVVGIFNGLEEGTTFTSSTGHEFTISYVGNDGNDIVLFAGAAETNVALNSAGEIVITDINSDSTDTLTVTFDAAANTYTISEANGDLVLNTTGFAGGQIVRPNAQTVVIDASAIPGGVTGLQVNTTGPDTSTVGVEEDDTITIETVNGPLTLTGDISLTADDVTFAEDAAIDLSGGNGAVTIDARQQIEFAERASITTGTGAITLTANAANDAISGAPGGAIDLTGDNVIQTTSGTITLEGTGSGGGNFKPGIRVVNGQIRSTSGAIDLTGVAAGDGVSNWGIQLRGNGTEVTTSGDIRITGTSGLGAEGSSGVEITRANIAATGSGTITISGTAGATGGAATDDDDGVFISDNATISTVDGAIVVTGLGEDGVEVSSGANITSTNGTIELNSDEHFLLDATGSLTAGGTVTINVDQIGAIDANGGVVDLAGTVTAGGEVFITGGSEDDVFNLTPSTTAEMNIDGNDPSTLLNGDTINLINGVDVVFTPTPGATPGAGIYTFGGGQQQIDFQEVEIDNIAPDVVVDTGDSDAETVTESNDPATASDPLQTDGTLTVNDLGTNDAIVTTVAVNGPTNGITEAEFRAMFSIDPLSPAPVVVGPETQGTINWEFDSGTESFSYLGAGDILTVTYTILVEDIDGLTDTQEVTVTIAGANDVPVISNVPTHPLTYTEGDGEQIISHFITITDADDTTLTGATVTISDGYVRGEDVLRPGFTPSGVYTVWNSATGTLTFVGTATIEQYTFALREVAYENISDDPASTFRDFTFTVSDDEGTSLPVTRQFFVIPVDDPVVPPVIEAPQVITDDGGDDDTPPVDPADAPAFGNGRFSQNDLEGIQSSFRDLADQNSRIFGGFRFDDIASDGQAFSLSDDPFGEVSDEFDSRERSFALTPFFSGVGTPGSTVMIEVFDEFGFPVAETMTTTSLTGDWYATFPGEDFSGADYRVEITLISVDLVGNPLQTMINAVLPGSTLVQPDIVQGLSAGEIFGATLDTQTSDDPEQAVSELVE